MSDTEASRLLALELIRVYRRWVERRLDDLGIPPPSGLEAALDEGERWLEEALDELLSRPFAEQPRGPLEVFQEAMGFPTAALAEAGVEPVRRDPAAERALPGDRYALAPVSSSELGDEVWRAHLAWGHAKAQAMGGSSPPRDGGRERGGSPPPRNGEGVGGRGPAEERVIGLLSRDVMDRSKVEEAARPAGVAVRVWRSEEEATSEVLVALVDLAHPDADPVISRLGEAGVTVYAYGPHVDDWALRRARSLGATDALPRSRFFRRLPEILPTVA